MPPEFRLLPWERGGHPVAPAMDLCATVEGQLRQFQVKQREGRLYFRFADEGPADERVWTLLGYDSQLPLEIAFREQVETNQVARFFVVSRGFSTKNVGEADAVQLNARFHTSNLHMFGPTCFGVVACDDGSAFAQEWCGGPWVEFALKTRRSQQGHAQRPSIWSRGWNVAGMRKNMATLAGQFAFRPFAPPPESEVELRFTRGSHQELESLYRAAHVHFVISYLASGQRGVGWRFGGPSQGQTIQFNATIHAETQKEAVHHYNYWSVIPEPLMKLFLEHNTPVGGKWQHYNRQNYHYQEEDDETDESEDAPPASEPSFEFDRRVDYSFNPHRVDLKAEVAREPSAHERMEALLVLREWLEAKGYASQVHQLLKPYPSKT